MLWIEKTRREVCARCMCVGMKGEKKENGKKGKGGRQQTRTTAGQGQSKMSKVIGR